MSLGEDVGYLISRGNKDKTNSATSNMLSHKVTINLNMLGAIMEDIIVRNLNGTLIIIIKNNSIGMRSTHIGKKPMELKKLLSSVKRA